MQFPDENLTTWCQFRFHFEYLLIKMKLLTFLKSRRDCRISFNWVWKYDVKTAKRTVSLMPQGWTVDLEIIAHKRSYRWYKQPVSWFMSVTLFGLLFAIYCNGCDDEECTTVWQVFAFTFLFFMNSSNGAATDRSFCKVTKTKLESSKLPTQPLVPKVTIWISATWKTFSVNCSRSIPKSRQKNFSSICCKLPFLVFKVSDFSDKVERSSRTLSRRILDKAVRQWLLKIWEPSTLRRLSRTVYRWDEEKNKARKRKKWEINKVYLTCLYHFNLIWFDCIYSKSTA